MEKNSHFILYRFTKFICNESRDGEVYEFVHIELWSKRMGIFRTGMCKYGVLSLGYVILCVFVAQ